MNCNSASGNIRQGFTYEKTFEFQMPDPNNLSVYIPMDLSLYSIKYLLQNNVSVVFSQVDNFDIVGNLINIKIDPETTVTFSTRAVQEQFIFTLLSDPTENNLQYNGLVQILNRWQ